MTMAPGAAVRLAPERQATPSHLPLVDGARGIGALLVFVTHITALAHTERYAFYGDLAPHVGEVGLAILFAISGCLLSRPWALQRFGGPAGPALADYARNRVLRLLPLYWVVLTIQLLAPGGFPEYTDPGVPQYLLIQIYSEKWAFDGLKHSWTLCTETSFYVALVLYAVVAARSFGGRWRNEWLAIGLFAAVGPITQFVIFTIRDHWLIALQWLPGYMDDIGIGMALALVSIRIQTGGRAPRPVAAAIRHPGLTWLAAVVLFVVGMTLVNAKTALSYPQHEPALKWTVRHLIIAATAGLLLLPAILRTERRAVPERVLGSRALRWIGERSYGFYLWHLPVLLWFLERKLVGPFPLATYALESLAVTLLLADLSYRLVETPAFRLKS